MKTCAFAAILFLGSITSSGQTSSNSLSLATDHIASGPIEGPDHLICPLNSTEYENKMLANVNTLNVNLGDSNNLIDATVKRRFAVTLTSLERATFGCDNDGVPTEWAAYGTSRRLTNDNSAQLMALTEFRATDDCAVPGQYSSLRTSNPARALFAPFLGLVSSSVSGAGLVSTPSSPTSLLSAVH
jgi:hypothetical protein